jgi:branched-chain amino acid transport system permease protein
LLGAAVLIPLEQVTRAWLGGSGRGVDLMLYGALIMIVALARPAGLVSLFQIRRRVARAGSA